MAGRRIQVPEEARRVPGGGKTRRHGQSRLADPEGRPPALRGQSEGSVRGAGRAADVRREFGRPGRGLALHRHLLPRCDRPPPGRERQLHRVPRREFLHHPDRAGRGPHQPRRFAAGDPAFHRIPRTVPRRPRGALAAERGPHDTRRVFGQSRSEVLAADGSLFPLRDGHRQVPRHRPPRRRQPVQRVGRRHHGRLRQRRLAGHRHLLLRPDRAHGVLPQQRGWDVRRSDRLRRHRQSTAPSRTVPRWPV